MVAKYEWLMWPFVILVFSVTCFALYNLLVHLMLTWLAVEQISSSNSKSIDMNFDHEQLRPVIYMYFAKNIYIYSKPLSRHAINVLWCGRIVLRRNGNASLIGFCVLEIEHHITLIKLTKFSVIWVALPLDLEPQGESIL